MFLVAYEMPQAAADEVIYMTRSGPGVWVFSGFVIISVISH